MNKTTDTSNIVPDLLEPSLAGAWIAEHRRIWQMDFLNAYKFGSFSHDRGLASFNERDVTQLWQLGLIRADLITSRRKLRLVGLVDRGADRYGRHIYSDERQIPRRLRTWKNVRNNLKPLQEGIELLFHPFRYYVLYHLDRNLGANISKMQIFSQNRFPDLLDLSLSFFNRWAGSEQFFASIKKWNDIASLCIMTEPCSYLRIFNTLKYSPDDVQSHQSGAEEIRQHMVDYWQNNVKDLYLHMGMKQVEEIRTELCFNAEIFEPNQWVQTLVCLGDSKLRLELEGHLGELFFSGQWQKY